MGIINHIPYLTKSAHPAIIGKKDMVVLSGEESARWFSREPDARILSVMKMIVGVTCHHVTTPLAQFPLIETVIHPRTVHTPL